MTTFCFNKNPNHRACTLEIWWSVIRPSLMIIRVSDDICFILDFQKTRFAFSFSGLTSRSVSSACRQAYCYWKTLFPVFSYSKPTWEKQHSTHRTRDDPDTKSVNLRHNEDILHASIIDFLNQILPISINRISSGGSQTMRDSGWKNRVSEMKNYVTRTLRRIISPQWGNNFVEQTSYSGKQKRRQTTSASWAPS